MRVTFARSSLAWEVEKDCCEGLARCRDILYPPWQRRE